MAAAGSRVRDDFFAMIPRRSVVVFLAAVFCVFAPVGLLFVTSFRPERPFVSVLVNLVVSGLLAVSWAGTFTVSRWFAIGIVGFTALLVSLNGALKSTPIGIGAADPSFEALGFVLSIVAGYILFVVFISGQGRTAMRLMTEMTLARNIHDTLVPPLEFSDSRIEAFGVSAPSTEMGGDLIDLVDHDDVTDLFLADVSGHGVRAGVVMGMVKSAIRMGLRRRESLSKLLRDLNDVLEATTSADLYATFAGIRIGRNLQVEYSLAGHHHIVHHRAASSDVARLGGRGFPLGLFGDQDYATEHITLRPGDLLAVYTDGLNETAGPSDEELGHEAIERRIRQLAGKPLREIHRAVLDLVDAYGKQTDDRTLLLVRAVPG
jgi:multidrug transporter EmrE-like cation transporter